MAGEEATAKVFRCPCAPFESPGSTLRRATSVSRYTRPPISEASVARYPLNDLLGISSLIVVSAAVFGPMAGWYATRRSRQPLVWLVLGGLLGPVALLLLALAPPGRCVACDTAVRGWPSRCGTCGLAFGARDSTAALPAEAIEPSSAEVMAPLEPRSADPTPPRPRLVRTVPPVTLAQRLATTPPVSRFPATAPDSHAPIEAAEVLATGVYFGGTARLVVGSRYAIVRHGSILRLMGPLDSDPSVVAVECSLDRVTATVIQDRLVVSDSEGGGLSFAIGGLAGATGPQLEDALAVSGPDTERVAR